MSHNLPPAITQKVQIIKLNARTVSRQLEIEFSDGRQVEISFELMRVYSPSAEVRGHGIGQEILQIGKRLVGVTGIEPVGNYAIKPLFTDGHSSGLFTWEYLYWLGLHQEALWTNYLLRLQAAGYQGQSGRDAIPEKNPPSRCGS